MKTMIQGMFYITQHQWFSGPSFGDLEFSPSFLCTVNRGRRTVKQQLGGERIVLLKGIEKVLFGRRLLVYGLTQRQYRQLHSKQDRLASRSSKPSSPDDLPSLTAPPQPSIYLYAPPYTLFQLLYCSQNMPSTFLTSYLCSNHSFYLHCLPPDLYYSIQQPLVTWVIKHLKYGQ